MNIAILGASWGDEGKGHITHHFSKSYDWVVRFNGGANAGHTIYRDGKKFVHNLMPSVDFRVPQLKAYLGSGMVIDVFKLLEEVKSAEESFPGSASRIYVDKNAFMVLAHHKDLDAANNAHIGSTNRGIGPAYAEKIGRKGFRIRDFFNTMSEPKYSDPIREMTKLGVNFVDLLDVREEMSREKILFEGAQGVLLDINHGIYPYVSCSDCTIGGIYSSGFNFAPPKKVYGVAKCYTTKVGEGPFPTECEETEAVSLRERGNEYGATTGRPRRIGWLDLPALNYACKMGGITNLIITKIDILSGMEEIPVCNVYSKPVTSSKDFFTAEPQYVKMRGWSTHSKADQKIGDFAMKYDYQPELYEFIALVEKSTGCPVDYISKGTSELDIVPFDTK